MADEYQNKVAPEFSPQSENKLVKENVFVNENKAVNENVPVRENVDSASEAPKSRGLNKAKKDKALGALSASLVGTIALVLTTMTSLVNVKMKAKFVDDVVYEDGVIKYEVNVSNMTEKEKLFIYLVRDGKQLERIKLEDEDGDGIISGQQAVDKQYVTDRLASSPNIKVEYILRLKGNIGLDVERPYENAYVTIEKQTSVFESVSSECRCGEDGHFYFTMNFTDDNAIFTDFKAWIEDAYYDENAPESEKAKHISYCKFTENLHDEQRIFVNHLTGATGKLFIKYKADGVTTYVIDGGTSTEKAGIPIKM